MSIGNFGKFMQRKPKLDRSRFDTLVSSDTVITGGIISYDGTLMIDGTVKAEIARRFDGINQNSNLIVGLHGTVISPTLNGDYIVVEGTVEGDVTATTQLIVRKTGKIKGNVKYGSLLIESGGVIEGNLQMISPAQSEAPQLYQAQPA